MHLCLSITGWLRGRGSHCLAVKAKGFSAKLSLLFCWLCSWLCVWPWTCHLFSECFTSFCKWLQQFGAHAGKCVWNSGRRLEISLLRGAGGSWQLSQTRLCTEGFVKHLCASFLGFVAFFLRIFPVTFHFWNLSVNFLIVFPPEICAQGDSQSFSLQLSCLGFTGLDFNAASGFVLC